MSFDEDIPPPYSPELSGLCDLPEYLPPTSIGHDYLLPFSLDPSTSSSSCGHHIYNTKSLKISLGEKLWGLNIPGYGYGATIFGRMHIHNPAAIQVSIKLQGWVSTANGTSKSRHPLCLNSKTTCSFTHITSHGQTFSLSIPEEVEYLGKRIPIPASHFSRCLDSNVNVCWELSIHASRKGFHMKEKYKIPILYLPKSRPPASHLVNFPLCLSSDDVRIKTTVLSLTTKPTDLDIERITLTLPSTHSFAAGSRIPISITVHGNCTSQIQNKGGVSFMEALSSSTSVTLIKKTSICPDSHSRAISSVTRVSYVEAFEIVRLSRDEGRLNASLYAGESGRETSFCIPGTVEVKYLLKIVSKPNTRLQEEYGVPSFSHAEELMLTTDPWGTDEWELKQTRGIPIPALGLAPRSQYTTFQTL